ncbi:hypothetical protein [Hyalangium sp.]|uniref:hypothetical protein n=1 Tax=Hyalangium sp. TaxID=2028555 RepID=UPI002D730546|nr:hypothetical protein [Hyalangium sp.]HYI03136.1 hypothetical protein [Hyalangium sp.]
MPTTADDSRTCTLFYSWQSDIKPDSHGRNLIRAALRNAASTVEAKLPGLRLTIDEATRGEPGSPDIPSTIFDKIGSADIFIADVSIINSSASADRKTPNPNVLVELGYAAGLLGWRRVIMVANQELGTIDSLPFDIRQKRITPFRCPLPSGDATKDKNSVPNALGALSKHLADAIEEIVKLSPERPVVVATDPQAIKRERDLRTLRDLFQYLNPDIIDNLAENAPSRVDFVVFSFWESFHALWAASSTHLYDETANSLMVQVHQYWGELLSHGTHYDRVPGGFYVWHLPGDFFPSQASGEDYKKATGELRALIKAHFELVGYLRSNYVELDLESLRKASWMSYQEFQRTFLPDKGQG